MQFEQLESSSSCSTLTRAWKEIAKQLPTAAAYARRRAERQGREHTPEIHFLVSCRAGRHRAQMSSEWIGQGLETFLDVGSVEFVRHHLRPAPQDSRGRCGCHLGYCSVFPQRDRARANQICVEYREKARATALYLAASALNQQMDGARRIDSEGSWPLASAAAADSKQVEVAPPRVGAAPRAHSTTLAEATQKREAAEKEAAKEAARRAEEGELMPPALFQLSDADIRRLGAPRPVHMTTGWKVYQLRQGLARAWLSEP